MPICSSGLLLESFMVDFGAPVRKSSRPFSRNSQFFGFRLGRFLVLCIFLCEKNSSIPIKRIN